MYNFAVLYGGKYTFLVPLVECVPFLTLQTSMGGVIANLAVGNTTANLLTFIFMDVESEGAVEAGEA